MELKTQNKRTKTSVQRMQPFQPVPHPDDLITESRVDQMVRLSLNENLYGHTPKVKEAVKAWLDKDQGYYYPDSRVSQLRTVISNRHHLDPNQLVFTNGLDEMIQTFARTFIEPGDQVLAHVPTFPEYQVQTEVDSGIFIGVPMKAGNIDWTSMVEALSEETKLVFICNPNNPTGTYEPLANIIEFLEVVKVRAPQALVVVDEAYYEFTGLGDDQSAIELVDDFPQLAVMRTFSKAYGLANFRCGYTVFNLDNAFAADSVRMPFNVSGATQIAALTAYQDQAHVQSVVEQTKIERDKWQVLFDELGFIYYPSETNFIMFQTKFAGPLVDYAFYHGFMLTTHTYPDWIRLTLPKAEDGERLRLLFMDFFK